MAEQIDTPAASRSLQRGFFRRWVFPILVIAAIAGVIWWLDNRNQAAVSPSGQRYGAAELPAALAMQGIDVSPGQGKLAPDFLLEAIDGSDLRLSDLRGRPVILNFWATWCESCRKEMPEFVDAQARLADQGLTVVAVNMQEGKSIVSPFAQERGMKFAVLIDRTGDVGDEYRLLGLPTTFFIGRDGIVRSVFTGPFVEQSRGTNVQEPIGAQDLEQRIAEILAPPPAKSAAGS